MKKPTMPLMSKLSERHEQPELIRCPGCGNSYLPGEVRLAVSCPVCSGQAPNAAGADEEMEKYLDYLRVNPTQENVNEAIRLGDILAPSYWQFEIRRYIRWLKQNRPEIVIQEANHE